MAAFALPRPCLMLVTDRALVGGGDGLVEVVAAAVEGGANAVQLREKDLAPTNLARLAGQLGEALRERSASGQRALLIVNGSADVAREIGADGLHLPADAPFARPDGITLVGRSVHSVEEAVKAEREGADYLIAGPIYQTRSHGGAAPAGLRLISAVVAVVSVPVVAIGGITAARLPDVLSAGAGGVAVISAILGASSPAAAASALREALEGVPLRARRAAVER